MSHAVRRAEPLAHRGVNSLDFFRPKDLVLAEDRPDHRTTAALPLPSFVFVLAACPVAPLSGGDPPDHSCLPDWPEECFGVDETTDGDPETSYECAGASALEDGQRAGYSCLPVPEDGDCPAFDSQCVTDAFEGRFVVDCRECLRESVEVQCGPDPEVADACCYSAVITAAEDDDCG